MLLYLPPYSPDLNPMEESFSTCIAFCSCIHVRSSFFFSLGKAYIRRHGVTIRTAENPILALLDACGCINGEMAIGWFYHAGYIVMDV
jgi:hypothetical protein